MGMCPKCTKITGVLVLLAGIGFLLQDWSVWNFWGLNWYTVVFLLFGLVKLAKCSCKDCMACCQAPMAAPAKKR